MVTRRHNMLKYPIIQKRYEPEEQPHGTISLSARLVPALGSYTTYCYHHGKIESLFL